VVPPSRYPTILLIRVGVFGPGLLEASNGRGRDDQT
jgi:hypothetical protein